MRTLITMILLASAVAAHAADPAPRGARLAATCTGCHGTNGATIGNALPPLAGQDRAALLAKLRTFRDGSTPSTVMAQIAKGYSEEQLEQIAAWFATQGK